jgi:hypothetical protein
MAQRAMILPGRTDDRELDGGRSPAGKTAFQPRDLINSVVLIERTRKSIERT